MNIAIWLLIDAASILTGAGANDIPGPPPTPTTIIHEYSAPAVDYTLPEVGVWRCIANSDDPLTVEVEDEVRTFVYGGWHQPWVDDVCIPESEYVEDSQ